MREDALRILIYELITGGGWRHGKAESPPPASLLAEGRAMRDALVRDFSAVPGVEASFFHDCRLPPVELPARVSKIRGVAHEREELTRCAAAGGKIVLIAPEFEGLLSERCRWVEDSGGELLSADSGFVALASDKQATAERLQAAGVPVPQGVSFGSPDEAPPNFPFPAVLKPVDGAGSQAVRRVAKRDDTLHHRRQFPEIARWRLERFVPGLAASIAALGGPKGWRLLLPGWQLLSDDGEFRYLGGELPLPSDLAARAESLAHRALAALPSTRGYVGIDLVLGPAPDGRDDAVIEINPRLTTSYLGLRRLARTNLAAAWLAWLEGDDLPLSWREGQVRFSPDGS